MVVAAVCGLPALLLMPGATAAAQTTELPAGVTVVQEPLVPTENPPAKPLLLGAGDLLEIQVFNTPELSGRARVDQRGVLRLPLGAELNVADMSPAQAAKAIEDQLQSGQYMLNPHVTVFVAEYATQGVTLLGEIKSPGTYNFFGAHTLYDALTAAGGVTPTAGASITITHRRDPSHPVIIPVSSPNYSQLQQATFVEPGDSILVSKAAMFYIVGDVGHPGAFYMQNGAPITVLEALALSAGVNKTAKANKAVIVRPKGDGAESLPLNLDRIMKNLDPNPVLQAADVLVVPQSGLKVLMQTLIPSASAAVTSAVATSLVVRN